MIKKQINPKYEFLSRHLSQLITHHYFNTQGELLFAGRNTIKRFCLKGIDIVVKQYGHITVFNQLMYSTFRKSKATRAFLHATKLRTLGISTPEEIGVIEVFKNGILQESYFVSTYSNYNSMAFLRDIGFDRKNMYPLINALVEWIVKVHDKGILHQDLNVSNILYKECSDKTYEFQVIDNNRMKFSQNPSINIRLKNLSRLSVDFELHNYILKQYAHRVNHSCDKVQMKGCFYKLMLEYRQLSKKWIKQFCT